MRSRSIALVLVCGLAACSSGGGTTPAPARAVSAPAGHATGTLTIRYPIVHRLKKGAAHRAPRFVDPNGATLAFSDTTPNGGPADPSASTNITVLPGPDGTQTANVSLIAGNSVLTVNESDDGGNLLASGTTFLSATVAGSTQALTVTLNMVAVGVAVTSNIATGSDVTPLSSDPANPTDWPAIAGCPVVLGSSYLLPYDAANSYTLIGQNVGLGGIPLAQIVSQASDNFGTTKLATDVGGGIRVLYDAAHDGVNGTIQVLDPFGNLETTAYIRYSYQSC